MQYIFTRIIKKNIILISIYKLIELWQEGKLKIVFIIYISLSKVKYLTFWRDGIIFDIFITTAEYDTLYDKKVSGNTVWNPFFTSQWWQHGYSISDSRNFLYHSNIFNVTTNTIDALTTGEIHVDTVWIEEKLALDISTLM